VSFALNNPDGSRLSTDAIERAKAAAKKLNYTPNFAARTLRTQRTHSLGFLSSDVAVTRFAMAMIASALRMADTHDMALLIAETGTDVKRAKRATRALLDRQIDGLIVAEMGAKQVDLPDVPAGLPIVFANALGPAEYVSILPDEKAGAQAVVDELLSGNLKSSIWIIGGHPVLETDLRRSATIGTRMRAIREALVAGGVSNWSEEKAMDWTPELGYQTIKRLASEGKMPDAVIALNDNIALGVYSACNELGVVIGKDISIVSFDDDELVSYLKPGLTTARLPYAEIGELAVKALVEDALEPGVVLIPMPLQVRASVAKG
jgi:LacI family transcriptional regulator